MDRISHLPDFIVHHILSFLDNNFHGPLHLVRISVLSKKWFHITASFPNLYFNIHQVSEQNSYRIGYFTEGIHVPRQSFFKYVEYTTTRFSHQNLTAHTFNLITDLQEPAELDIVNKCIELVLKNGVRELKIDITCSPELRMSNYRLPNILLSVSMLKRLTISGCELPSSLMADAVNFKFLIHLTLEFVRINDDKIKYLTSSCPLLQDFHISRCHGFERLCVHGHQNLQKVWVQYNTPVESVDIEAPNLSELTIVDMDQRGAPRMNLGLCKKLTTVTYYGSLLPNSNVFSNFLSNFPFVENICLVTQYKCNLKLSSNSLRTLVLSGFDMEQVELSTPNLVVLDYYTFMLYPNPQLMDYVWRLVRQAAQMKACMQCHLKSSIDALWFQKLRLFLDKKHGFKVLNLCIDATVGQKIIFPKLKEIKLPPYELENVKLKLSSGGESSDHVAFVGAVLWCCRPRSLKLQSSYSLNDFKDVAKFIYEKLLEQEDEGHTKIQIVSHSSTESPKHMRDLMSLSMALPTITFVKEEAG